MSGVTHSPEDGATHTEAEHGGSVKRRPILRFYAEGEEKGTVLVPLGLRGPVMSRDPYMNRRGQ